jgi:hypothetical protein
MPKLTESIYIADVKAKLYQIVNHPELSPSVIEILLKNAHFEACIRADKELEEDYTTYKENIEKEVEQ